MVNYQKKFLKEYQKLNPDQKQAVDTIDGPVMVIAGAGTGKTQTIALRIANILAKTDTPASAILCLTFTDNASFNMRSRLLGIIGPAAYQVRIHTFHSFCHQIISTNPDIFNSLDLRHIEEIEKIEIISNIVSKLAYDSPLKPLGDPVYYVREIISVIQTLKREGFGPKNLKKLLDDQQNFISQTNNLYLALKKLRPSKSLEEDILQILTQILKNPATPPYLKSIFSQKYSQYQQGSYDIGKAKNPAINFKNDILSTIEDIEKNLPKQVELLSVFKKYQQKLAKNHLFDFDDMINFVTDKFGQDKNFLRSFQAQVHYILVDEFQDSNNSQIKLINQLASFFSKPNLFVVGDDDQSIFRFQGASVENILNFYHQYSPQIFILKNNYRSHQLILDSAQSVISHNQSQLVKHVKSVDKNLCSNVNYDPDPINLFEFQNSLDEASSVVNTVKNLLNRGVEANQIAILYRQHQDSLLVEKLLSQENISYTKAKSNLLTTPHINYFLRTITAIVDPSSTNLYSFLCIPFLKINSLSLLKTLKTIHKHKHSLTDFLFSKKSKNKKINHNLKLIADCQKLTPNLPLDKLFIAISDQFSYLNYLSKLPNSYQALSDFYNLFTYLKNFLSTRPKAQLSDFISRINLLIDHNLDIPQSFSPNAPLGINLITAHGAKGLEFDHVFIINCLDGKWGNSQKRSIIKLPLGILSSDFLDNQQEEERRLFYVALTRAKKQIYLSFPTTRDNGRLQNPSQFIFEIDPKNIDKSTTQSSDKAGLIAILSTNPLLLDSNQNQQFILDYLKNNYKFNISHLNSYLNCPFCFFYKSIIRIPLLKSPKASLGTAVHQTLSEYYNKPIISLDSLLSFFKICLIKEQLDKPDHLDMLSLGLDIIKDYYSKYPSPKGQFRLDLNFSNRQIFLANIPLTGKIDKLELLSSRTGGKQDVIVTDFKTGRFDYNKTRPNFDAKGGDYFRQILFYKLLLDLDPGSPYHFKSGQIEYVEPPASTKFPIKKIDFSPADVDQLKKLIKDTYQNILDLKFPINPDCKNRDNLHQYLWPKLPLKLPAF